MVIVYLASLAGAAGTAFWARTSCRARSSTPSRSTTSSELRVIDVNRTIVDPDDGDGRRGDGHRHVLAFPLAYYMARVASPRLRALLVVGILMPLWSSYLVRVYTWRLITANGRRAELAAGQDRAGAGRHRLHRTSAMLIVFVYLWLPYMVAAHLRGARADPGLAAGGVRRPGRAGLARRAQGDPAAGPARHGGRLDLHLLADAGRLHRARPGRRGKQFIGNVIYFNRASPTTCRSRRRSPSSRSRSWSSTCSWSSAPARSRL